MKVETVEREAMTKREDGNTRQFRQFVSDSFAVERALPTSQIDSNHDGKCRGSNGPRFGVRQVSH
jgi:hypothetical protein